MSTVGKKRALGSISRGHCRELWLSATISCLDMYKQRKRLVRH
jgi:hypothetical protein